jgi:hypothetical protein
MKTHQLIMVAAADWMTAGVAIWGAITGTAALALNAAKEFRDRPDLRMSLSYGVDIDGSWWQVAVTNHGRRPVTVVEAGILIALDFITVTTDQNGRATEGRFQPTIWTTEEEPYLLQPGDMRRHRGDLAEWPSMLVTADMPIRAFATDSRGKRAFTAPAYALRDLLSAGWSPDDEVPDDYRDASNPILPKPLAPRWKIWRPRIQRGSKQDVYPELHLGPVSSEQQAQVR